MQKHVERYSWKNLGNDCVEWSWSQNFKLTKINVKAQITLGTYFLFKTFEIFYSLFLFSRQICILKCLFIRIFSWKIIWVHAFWIISNNVMVFWDLKLTYDFEIWSLSYNTSRLIMFNLLADSVAQKISNSRFLHRTLQSITGLQVKCIFFAKSRFVFYHNLVCIHRS